MKYPNQKIKSDVCKVMAIETQKQLTEESILFKQRIAEIDKI